MVILAVVVLYKVALSESQTMTSFGAMLQNSPQLLGSVQILVWDNSPEPLESTVFAFPLDYHHSTENVGLSGAYNRAAARANAEDIPWLLLLDQDTSLPPDFLADMLTDAVRLKERGEIAAIVPTVLVGAHQPSPRRVLFNSFEAYTAQQPGVAEGELAAINSASLMRVASLLQIGGYSDAFWLDYSDYYVFHQFYRHGMRVWRAAQIRVQHSMTILDYDNLMSPWRYNNFIRAEGAFHDIYKGRLENAVQTLRLLARTLRQYRRFKNPVFSKITFRYFWWRVAHGKTRRIAHWQRASQAPR